MAESRYNSNANPPSKMAGLTLTELSQSFTYLPTPDLYSTDPHIESKTTLQVNDWVAC
jgi:hypothetical protein